MQINILIIKYKSKVKDLNLALTNINIAKFLQKNKKNKKDKKKKA